MSFPDIILGMTTSVYGNETRNERTHLICLLYVGAARGGPPLLHPGVGVGGGHGLDHVGGVEEAHEAEDHEEDGPQGQPRLAEGFREG